MAEIRLINGKPSDDVIAAIKGDGWTVDATRADAIFAGEKRPVESKIFPPEQEALARAVAKFLGESACVESGFLKNPDGSCTVHTIHRGDVIAAIDAALNDKDREWAASFGTKQVMAR